jgi:hypothetical protein
MSAPTYDIGAAAITYIGANVGNMTPSLSGGNPTDDQDHWNFLVTKNNTEIVNYTSSGTTITIVGATSGAYQLWYPSVSGKLLVRSLLVKNVINTVSVNCIVGIVTHVKIPGIRTQQYSDANITVSSTAGTVSINANSAGTFTTILQGNILLNINATLSPVSWKCNAMAEPNMPYVVMLPVTGAVSALGPSGEVISTNVMGSKCYIATSLNSATVKVIGDITVTINVTFTRRSSMLASYRVRNGILNIPNTIGMYSDSMVTYIAVDDVDLMSALDSRGVQLPYVSVRSDVNGCIPVQIPESTSSLSTVTQLSNGNAASGIYHTMTSYEASVPIDAYVPTTQRNVSEFSQVFSMSDNSLYFNTYYDGLHKIVICCKSATFASYVTYNGSFSIAAYAGLVKVPLGETIAFTANSESVIIGPPSYNSTANYAVEVVSRKLPTIVLASSFNPSFGTVLEANTHGSINATYDFNNRAYTFDNRAGIERLDIVYTSAAKIIEFATHMIIRGQMKSKLIEKSYTMSSVSAVINYTEVLVSMYVIAPSTIEIPVIEGGLYVGDGYTISITTPMAITITASETCDASIMPTIIWCTATTYGTLIPTRQ